jgi:hypothetical protein
MKAIAMKCTQEDWDSVKDQIKFSEISDFKIFPYLVTNFRDSLGLVSNLKEPKRWHRTVYETFDKDILFDALDIEVEKVFKACEIQYKDKNGHWCNMYYDTEYRIKPINPELNELKEKAKSLGYKLIPLFLLLFFNLGFSQQAVQHYYISSQNLMGGEIMINRGNDTYIGGGFSGTLKNEFTKGDWAGKHISESEMKYATGTAKEEWFSIYAIASFGYYKKIMVSYSAGMGLYGQMMNFERNGVEYNKNDKLIFVPLVGIAGQYAITKDVGLMVGVDTFNGVKIGISVLFN